MAENNHQRTLALRAPRGVLLRPQRPGARREPPLVHHLDRPRAHQGSRPHDPDALRGRRPRSPASVRAIVARHRSRAELSSDRGRRRRLAGAGGGDHRAASRLRAAGRRRRGGADAAVSRRSASPRTCSDMSARSNDAMVAADDTLKSGDLVGQAGIEKIYNPLLMGTGRRQGRRRQQPRPRDPHARGSAADRRQAAAAHDRLRPAEGRSRTAFKAARDARLTNAGAAVVLDPQYRRSARVLERAGVRPERLRGGHRSRDVGVAEQRRAAAAQRPRAAGALFARFDASRWRSALAGSRRA